MAAQGKKKTKVKGKTLNLTEFLSDDKGGSTAPSFSSSRIDWAAEMDSNDMEDLGEMDFQRSIDRSKLPTAPKAARGPDIDLSTIPTQPPFTAFIGNLPYDTTEENIANFFRNQKVVNVRLPTDQGRLRGFGYVEFEDRQSLIDALGLNDENMGGRKMRVDLAGQSQQNDGGQQRGFGDRRNEGPDRTDISDWRRGPPPDSDFDRRDDRNQDRRGGGDRWGGGRGFEDRGPSRGYDDRGPSRGFDRDDRGSSRGYDRDDRGSSRGYDRDDRGPSRGYDRDDRGPSRGYDRDDRGPSRGYDDRRSYDRDRGYDRDDRGPSRGYDRGGRDEWSSRNRDYDDRGPSRGYRDGGRGYGNDRGYDRGNRYDDRDGGRKGFGSGFNRDDGYDRQRSERPRSRESSREVPTERPRLNLQPRTKPKEDTTTSENSQTKKTSGSSIFGAAKPVDTTAREREIEERLQRQRLDESRRTDDEKENRNVNNPSRGGRPRRDSDNSQDGGRRNSYEGGRRERRLSSNSSGKGRSGPPSQGRSRKDSDKSNHSQEVFSGGEDGKEEPKSPISPEHREEVKLVPAPPPTVNVWDQRKSDSKSSPSQDAKSPPSHSQVPPKSESKSKSSLNESPPVTNAWSKGKPADLTSSETPKSNPWFKNKAENRESFPGEGRGGSSRGGSGRGRGSDRGRGGKSKPLKEKPLPKSIEEMPKYEEKTEQVWTNANKFAGLIGDEEEEEGDME